jgi:hypothetical protein
MRQSLWWAENNSTWPRDSRDWVFLARAVYEIGRARYPSEWTGDEPVTWRNPSPATETPLPEDPSEADHRQVQYAHQVLKEQHPEVAAKVLTFPTLIRPDDWKLARIETERLRLVSLRIIWRFEAITRMIATEAEAGRLVTGLRPTDGGVVRVMPVEWWNTENLCPRFTMCQMHPAEPFSRAFTGEDFEWIFVRAKSLKQFVNNLKSKPASSTLARRRATEFLRPIVSEPKPERMTKSKLKKQCMEQTGVNDSGFRETWEYLKTSGVTHSSWSKRGAPKMNG